MSCHGLLVDDADGVFGPIWLTDGPAAIGEGENGRPPFRLRGRALRHLEDLCVRPPRRARLRIGLDRLFRLVDARACIVMRS